MRYRQRYLEHYTRVGVVIVQGALWRHGINGRLARVDVGRLANADVTGRRIVWPESVWDAYLNFYGPPPKWLVWLIGRSFIRVVPDEQF